MSDINVKEGLIKSLKTALMNDDFIMAVFDVLLGRPGAIGRVEFGLKGASQENTLNEVIAVHRFFKKTIDEGLVGKQINGIKELLRKVSEIHKKSIKFQRQVIFRALKKPGVLAALVKLILSKGTNTAALAIVAKAVIEASVEVAGKDEEMQVALSENIEINGNSVNIMVGRFQPFTLGHLKCLKSIKNSLGVPTLLCVIPGNGDDKHPFTGQIQDKMYEILQESHPDLIAGTKYVKNAFIEGWAIAAKELGLEPVSWTCGTDRFESYENMVQKHGQRYGLNPEFKVYCLDRADDNISASSVRECLINGNKEGFESQMPQCLWPMYDEMRQVMVSDTMPAQQVTLSEEEQFQRRVDEAFRKLLKEK